jgi:hypothetical protein
MEARPRGRGGRRLLFRDVGTCFAALLHPPGDSDEISRGDAKGPLRGFVLTFFRRIEDFER